VNVVVTVPEVDGVVVRCRRHQLDIVVFNVVRRDKSSPVSQFALTFRYCLKHFSFFGIVNFEGFRILLHHEQLL